MTFVRAPRAFRTDIVATTAAAPDMSVFIVSIPLAVFSESPPESNTTPLPTSASPAPRPVELPARAGGVYVIFMNRGGRDEPWPTPSTPPMRSARSCASDITVMFKPLPASSLRAATTNSAGDFSRAGSLIMSRAQMTACATTSPRSRPRFTSAPPATVTRRSCVGLASDL